MKVNKNRYELRGVSSKKEDVHKAIKNIDKGLYPKAFCKIVPDYLTNNDDYLKRRSVNTKPSKIIRATYARPQNLNNKNLIF